MVTNGNSKWIMWILGVLVSVMGSISVYAITQVDDVKKSLRTEYVQKDYYRADVIELKDAIRGLTDKVDRLLLERRR